MTAREAELLRDSTGAALPFPDRKLSQAALSEAAPFQAQRPRSARSAARGSGSELPAHLGTGGLSIPAPRHRSAPTGFSPQLQND